MYELSEDERIRLVSALWDLFGPSLNWESFTDTVLGMFEDIPGMDCLPYTQAQNLLLQLWKIYHEQGPDQEN